MLPSLDAMIRAREYINPLIGLYLGLKHLEGRKLLTLEALMTVDDAIERTLKEPSHTSDPTQSSLALLKRLDPAPSRDIPVGF